MFVSVLLLRFVAFAEMLLELSIMEGVIWLGGEDFAEWFCFKFDPVTEVSCGDGDGLGANFEGKSIMMTIDLEKNIS